MAKFLKCINNKGLPDFFKIGDLFECDEYDDKTYKVSFIENGIKKKARISKEFFTEDDEQLINLDDEDKLLDKFTSELMDRNLTLQIASAYFTNISQVINSLYFSSGDDKILSDVVCRRVVESQIIIDVLKKSLNIDESDISNYKKLFLSDVIKNLQEDKIII